MTQAVTNQEQMRDIRRRLLSGVITYDQAKQEATPLLDAIYEQHKIIAKKYNKRAVRLSFESLMR